MKNAAPRPGHELTLDAMPSRPYSRAHDQRRDHCNHRSPPPQHCGTGGFARLNQPLPPDPIRGLSQNQRDLIPAAPLKPAGDRHVCPIVL